MHLLGGSGDMPHILGIRKRAWERDYGETYNPPDLPEVRSGRGLTKPLPLLAKLVCVCVCVWMAVCARVCLRGARVAPQ